MMTLDHAVARDFGARVADKASFIGQVREGKVLPPTARGFDPAVWSAAYDTHMADVRDAPLHAAGLWFHEALSRRWRLFADMEIGNLPLDPVTRHLVGVANHVELLTYAKLTIESMKFEKEAPLGGSVAHIKLDMGKDDPVIADMVRTSALDQLGKFAQIIRTDIARGTGRGRFDAKTFVDAYALFEDIYLLEHLWGQVLWFDWIIESSEDAVALKASFAPDALAISQVVAEWRRDQLLAEFHGVYAQEWAATGSILSPRWGVDAKRKADGFVFDVRRREPGSGEISGFYVLREMLSDSELEPYLYAPLPNLTAGLTLDDLISAWELLSLAAESMRARLYDRGADAPHQRLAPVIPRAIYDALISELGWPPEKRRAALDFFTFHDRSTDGLWTRPLLPVGGDRLIPVLTPLTATNLYRTAELWALEGAGEKLFSERGTDFEERLRRSLAAGLAKRPWGARGTVLHDKWEPKIAGAPRDIDLVIRIDETVFIGEIKLKRFPVSAAEIGRHAKEFAKAAGQLELRLEWLAAHKAELAMKTGFDGAPDDLRIRGMIVTGTPFGSGAVIDGYPIVDRDMLQFYFDRDTMLTSARVDRASFYQGVPTSALHEIGLVDENPAASFLAFLRNPYPVRYAEKALQVGERHGLLKVSNQKLVWPEHHIDSAVFTGADGDELATTMRSEIERWREAARAELEGGLDEPESR